MPAFHVLTGCDYTSSFFGYSNFTVFSRMSKQENSESLLTSLATETIHFSEVGDFMMNVMYDRTNWEKNCGTKSVCCSFQKQKIH